MTDGAFEFARRGRAPGTAAVLVALYAAMAAAMIWLNAAWWLMAALALPTLPALWALWSNPSAGLRLSCDRLEWHSGRRRASVALAEIDHMRFDTRLDLSVRVTAVLADGARLRLPYESLPPHRSLERAFEAHDVRVVRHHFTLL